MREYPVRPIVGVGAVVLIDGGVLLAKRRFEPLAGEWSLPGGALEVGETLEAGVAREVFEETGLEVEVGPVVEVFDRILLDADRRVQFHFVLIDYLCRADAGVPVAGSDVSDVAVADPRDLDRFGLTDKAAAVIAKGMEMRKLVRW
jgi:ADP-ribose pyrophosphatase YjhB (NUDIX family)